MQIIILFVAVFSACRRATRPVFKESLGTDRTASNPRIAASHGESEYDRGTNCLAQDHPSFQECRRDESVCTIQGLVITLELDGRRA